MNWKKYQQMTADEKEEYLFRFVINKPVTYGCKYLMIFLTAMALLVVYIMMTYLVLTDPALLIYRKYTFDLFAGAGSLVNAFRWVLIVVIGLDLFTLTTFIFSRQKFIKRVITSGFFFDKVSSRLVAISEYFTASAGLISIAC